VEVERSMTREVVTCRQDDSLEQAARRMRGRDCGALPVLDARGEVAGMLTDRDICMAALDSARPLWAITVREAMSPDVFVLDPAQSLVFAAELMGEFQVRRLPVVDSRRRPRGILSLLDLARRASSGDVRGREDVGMDDVALALARIGRPRPAAALPAGRVAQVQAVPPRPHRAELLASAAARRGWPRTPTIRWRMPW
jgi:CBS domain-containing protein